MPGEDDRRLCRGRRRRRRRRRRPCCSRSCPKARAALPNSLDSCRGGRRRYPGRRTAPWPACHHSTPLSLPAHPACPRKSRQCGARPYLLTAPTSPLSPPPSPPSPPPPGSRRRHRRLQPTPAPRHTSAAPSGAGAVDDVRPLVCRRRHPTQGGGVAPRAGRPRRAPPPVGRVPLAARPARSLRWQWGGGGGGVSGGGARPHDIKGAGRGDVHPGSTVGAASSADRQERLPPSRAKGSRSAGGEGGEAPRRAWTTPGWWRHHMLNHPPAVRRHNAGTAPSRRGVFTSHAPALSAAEVTRNDVHARRGGGGSGGVDACPQRPTQPPPPRRQPRQPPHRRPPPPFTPPHRPACRQPPMRGGGKARHGASPHGPGLDRCRAGWQSIRAASAAGARMAGLAVASGRGGKRRITTEERPQALAGRAGRVMIPCIDEGCGGASTSERGEREDPGGGKTYKEAGEGGAGLERRGGKMRDTRRAGRWRSPGHLDRVPWMVVTRFGTRLLREVDQRRHMKATRSGNVRTHLRT